MNGPFLFYSDAYSTLYLARPDEAESDGAVATATPADGEPSGRLMSRPSGGDPCHSKSAAVMMRSNLAFVSCLFVFLKLRDDAEPISR